MSVAAADLHEAVTTLWQSSGLDALVKSYWSSGSSQYTSLNEGEASPGTPFPYVVFEQSPGNVLERMSGHDITENHRIDDIPWDFRVHTQQTPSISAKVLAATIAEEIMKVFGGHPTVVPTAPSFDESCFLLFQYQTDFPIRDDHEVYQWNIQYIVRLDVPEKKL